MSQRIHGWSRRLIAVACGFLVTATLVLASAAPVLAKSFHGGAHGRANTLIHSGNLVPLEAKDLIAFAAAAAVACVAVVVGRSLSARKASRIRLQSMLSDQVTGPRHAA
ncbi:MAG: hypothetical protein NTW58_01480 [Actinobacteria bacterium]|nr:hypothetical protein [Actinomycetota bacterium]